MSTIATLSGDPDGDRAGTIEQTDDGFEVVTDDGTLVGTLSESDVDALEETAETFEAGEEVGMAPELDGTASLGQVGGIMAMMLASNGHDALVLFNEDEAEEGPSVLLNAEDLLGLTA